MSLGIVAGNTLLEKNLSTSSQAQTGCIGIANVWAEPNTVSAGQDFTCKVTTTTPGGSKIACGWSNPNVAGNWPQTGGRWVGATCNGTSCSFGIRMDTPLKDGNYELVGFDNTTGCQYSGKRVPLSVNRPTNPTQPPIQPTTTPGQPTLPPPTSVPTTIPTQRPGLPTYTPTPVVSQCVLGRSFTNSESCYNYYQSTCTLRCGSEWYNSKESVCAQGRTYPGLMDCSEVHGDTQNCKQCANGRWIYTTQSLPTPTPTPVTSGCFTTSEECEYQCDARCNEESMTLFCCRPESTVVPTTVVNQCQYSSANDCKANCGNTVCQLKNGCYVCTDREIQKHITLRLFDNLSPSYLTAPGMFRIYAEYESNTNVFYNSIECPKGIHECIKQNPEINISFYKSNSDISTINVAYQIFTLAGYCHNQINKYDDNKTLYDISLDISGKWNNCPDIPYELPTPIVNATGIDATVLFQTNTDICYTRLTDDGRTELFCVPIDSATQKPVVAADIRD
jgi:hypothetical protein